jgi:hypothetical protein
MFKTGEILKNRLIVDAFRESPPKTLKNKERPTKTDVRNKERDPDCKDRFGQSAEPGSRFVEGYGHC